MFKSGFNLWTFWLTPNELFSLKRGPARVSKNSVSKGPQTIFVAEDNRLKQAKEINTSSERYSYYDTIH